MSREPVTVLVVGASGATGRLLVRQLLERGCQVRAMVRSPERLMASIDDPTRLSVVRAPVVDMTDADMARHVEGCGAIASCLGHNLTAKGMFGAPRRLVADAARRLTDAVRAGQPSTPVKYVLMSSAGVGNRDLDEPVSTAQRGVIGLLRWLLPPHADNEAAADYLRTGIGQNDPSVEWSVVRPDGLVNQDEVSSYKAHESPTRSAIFDAGQTSRLNVAHFMAELITDDEMWARWVGRMPVVYDEG